MSEPQDERAASAYRARWRRFSPSMGWRAFWSEIVIVVLGVVIALAANEAVQDWNWRNKVKDAEARLQGDIHWAFLWAAERSTSQPCVDAQLAAMARNVVDSGDRLQPMPVVNSLDLQMVVRMPNRPWRFPVWDALLADGTASHFDTQRQAVYGRIGDGMEVSRVAETESRRLGGRLLQMRDAIALDPAVRSSLLADINNLRSVTAYEGLNSRQRMRVIADAGLAPPEAMVEHFLNADGRNPSGPDFSGMPQFCTTRGLPLGDWRDYRKLPTMSILYPGVGAANRCGNRTGRPSGSSSSCWCWACSSASRSPTGTRRAWNGPSSGKACGCC
jgi:hypothetical protein